MRGEIRGWSEFSIDEATVEIDHDHILPGHGFVRHAAGLDGHYALFAVNGADIAPRQHHQAVLYQREVGIQNLFSEIVVHD